MTRARALVGGLAALVAVWVWPLPALGAPPFASHMTMHMVVVALAAPLLAWGIAGGRWDPVVRWPAATSPIVASMLELALVWAWHAPALHHLARHTAAGLALEQGSFLAAGLMLWVSALGGTTAQRRARATGGITGLLLTAMHMTLLGALLALAPRTLYGHHGHAAWGVEPLLDQHLGGAIMLLAGGAAYLAGGVALTADVLRAKRAPLAPEEAR